MTKKKLLKDKNCVSDLIGFRVFISHREELRNNQENLEKTHNKVLKKKNQFRNDIQFRIIKHQDRRDNSQETQCEGEEWHNSWPKSPGQPFNTLKYN